MDNVRCVPFEGDWWGVGLEEMTSGDCTYRMSDIFTHLISDSSSFFLLCSFLFFSFLFFSSLLFSSLLFSSLLFSFLLVSSLSPPLRSPTPSLGDAPRRCLGRMCWFMQAQVSHFHCEIMVCSCTCFGSQRGKFNGFGMLEACKPETRRLPSCGWSQE